MSLGKKKSSFWKSEEYPPLVLIPIANCDERDEFSPNYTVCVGSKIFNSLFQIYIKSFNRRNWRLNISLTKESFNHIDWSSISLVSYLTWWKNRPSGQPFQFCRGKGGSCDHTCGIHQVLPFAKSKTKNLTQVKSVVAFLFHPNIA